MEGLCPNQTYQIQNQTGTKQMTFFRPNLFIQFSSFHKTIV
jgi:hypothetical protein